MRVLTFPVVGGRDVAMYRGVGFATQTSRYCVYTFNAVSGVLTTFLGQCIDGTVDAINPMRFMTFYISLYVDCGSLSLLVVKQEMTLSK